MSNLAVKYDNKMNLLAFKDLEKIEASLFFSIVARLKEKGTESLIFNFSELTEFLDKNLTTKETIDLLNKGVGKIIRTAITWETDTQIILFSLFQEFIIDKQKKTLQASISPKFLYILNNFDGGNFTMFELAEFSNLKSKYTQTLYRLLKQYRSTGYLTMKWADFIEIMDIPTSYRVFDIERQILKPSIVELTQEADIFNQNNPIFKKLLYKKIRGKGRGRPIESIEFYFTPRKKSEKEQKQGEKALEYISQDIRQEQAIKQLKSQNKTLQAQIHPMTGQEITGFEQYIGRNIRMKNKFNEYDILKIQKIEKDLSGKIIINVRNVDDDFQSKMKFENLQHFENTFNRFKV